MQSLSPQNQWSRGQTDSRRGHCGQDGRGRPVSRWEEPKENHAPDSHVLGLDHKSLVRVCCWLSQESCLHDSGIHNYKSTNIFLKQLCSETYLFYSLYFGSSQIIYLLLTSPLFKNIYTSRQSQILEELVNHVEVTIVESKYWTSRPPLQDLWSRPKYSWAYLFHAKRSLVFGPAQNVHA